jgi:hypothetical protein
MAKPHHFIIISLSTSSSYLSIDLYLSIDVVAMYVHQSDDYSSDNDTVYLTIILMMMMMEVKKVVVAVEEGDRNNKYYHLEQIQRMLIDYADVSAFSKDFQHHHHHYHHLSYHLELV